MNILKTQYKLPAICYWSTTSDGSGGSETTVKFWIKFWIQDVCTLQLLLTAHPAEPVDLQAPFRSSKAAQTLVSNTAVTVDEHTHPITLLRKQSHTAAQNPSLAHITVLKLLQDHWGAQPTQGEHDIPCQALSHFPLFHYQGKHYGLFPQTCKLAAGKWRIYEVNLCKPCYYYKWWWSKEIKPLLIC